MTCIKDFNQKECEKIDAQCVDAYFDVALDDVHPEKLLLSNSWTDLELDLTPAIKAGETLTHLFLTPEDNPVALQYNAEHNVVDCINGEDLARIIPMTRLKDVDQNTAPTAGDVYLYDGTKFVPYNITTVITNLTGEINALKNRVSTLELTIANWDNRMTNIENGLIQHTSQINAINTTLTPPANAPNNIKVAWGNINLYSDYTNANLKTSGLYTHDLNTNVANDERFA